MRQLRRWCRRWTVSRASPQPGREHHQSQRGQGRFERALDVEHRWKYWRSRLSPAQASSPAVSRAIWERPDRKNRFCSTSTAKENGAGFGDLQHPCSYRCYRLNGGNEMVPEQKSNGTRRRRGHGRAAGATAASGAAGAASGATGAAAGGGGRSWGRGGRATARRVREACVREQPRPPPRRPSWPKAPRGAQLPGGAVRDAPGHPQI